MMKSALILVESCKVGKGLIYVDDPQRPDD